MIPEKQMSTKGTKNTNKSLALHTAKDNPMSDTPNECNPLFYFVPFVFFVDQLRFLK